MNTTALPDDLFIKHINSLTLYEKVAMEQHGQKGEQIKNWATQHTLNSTNHHWFKNKCLVIVEDNNLRRELVHTYHDTHMAGHARASTTLFSISCDYWWPNMKHFVMAYVRGCATCQSNKTNTRPNKPPLFPIMPEPDALPFQMITVDWITKLPQSNGYNSIMMVTDHDCTKAMIFIPCKETMGTEEMVEQYTRNVVVHYGLLNKIISDRDPQLTTDLFKELCHTFEVK